MYRLPISRRRREELRDAQAGLRRSQRSHERACRLWRPKAPLQFCTTCCQSGRRGTRCGHDTILSLDPRARIPRRSASRQKWRKFLALFVTGPAKSRGYPVHLPGRR